MVKFARWQVITEVLLFFQSIYLVTALQMRLRKKSVIVMAFGLRLL